METAIQKEITLQIGSVLVMNTHLISDNLLKLLPNMLADVDGILDAIVFRKDKPIKDGEAIYANFEPSTSQVTINLDRHFKATHDLLMDNKLSMLPRYCTWLNILISIYHEMYHVIEFCNDKNAFDADTCDKAQAWAVRSVIGLAKVVGSQIEPPITSEDPHFGVGIQAMELRVSEKSIDNPTDLSTCEAHLVNMMKDGIIQTGIDGVNPVHSMLEWAASKAIAEGDTDEAIWGRHLEEANNAAAVKSNEEPALPPEETTATHEPVAVKTDLLNEVPMTLEEVKACAQEVYKRLYDNIFDTCNYLSMSEARAKEISGDDVEGFASPKKVLKPVYIGDIPNAIRMFLTMDINIGAEDGGLTLYEGVSIWSDDARRPCAPGHVIGKLSTRNHLPMYSLNGKVGDQQFKRSLKPQNCNARHKDKGTLNPNSYKSRTGWRIAYVERDLTPAQTADKVSPHSALLECFVSPTIKYTLEPWDQNKRVSLEI